MEIKIEKKNLPSIRELLYVVIFQMKNNINNLKKKTGIRLNWLKRTTNTLKGRFFFNIIANFFFPLKNIFLRQHLPFYQVPNVNINWFETVISLYDQSPTDVSQSILLQKEEKKAKHYKTISFIADVLKKTSHRRTRNSHLFHKSVQIPSANSATEIKARTSELDVW